jgi:ribosomal protein L1
MTKIPDNKLKGFINNMLTERKERKFVETVDLQIGLKVKMII